MKKILAIACGVCLFYSGITAQEKQIKAEVYGFIRSEFYHDSYKGINAAMDNFYMFPAYAGVDPSGKEINKNGMTNYTAMATRFGFNITGPELLGAKSSANFETDFSGIVSEYPEVLRLRKAYLKLDWENASLLVGQTWHPLWNGMGGNYPKVGNLNTGAPFNPFNRSPQIDFDYRTGNITLSFTALYEQQYVSRGFYDTPNSNCKNLPKRNAGIPELVIGINHSNGAVTAGIAGQFNAIQPMSITDMGYVTEELNTSLVGMAYLAYNKDKLYMLAKGLYGQNMANMLMLGGYGAKTYDSATGEMTYTNYNNYSALFNLVYGTKVQLGLFAGIAGNLGTVDPLYNFDGVAKIAGLATSLKNMSRASTYLAYNIQNMKFVAEYEITSADWGAGEFDFSDGLYEDTNNATNHRFLLMVMYNF